jgi:hypothetical protein
MTIDLTIGADVKHLRRAGLRPGERLVRDILRAGPAAFRPLIELATDTELLHEEPPECYGPIHALRLLGEMPSVDMIAPLLSPLPITRNYADEQLPQLWLSELPQIIGRIGAAAIEPLWAIADDEARGIPARTVALVALAYVTVVAPDMRDAVIAGLRERLSTSADPTINAYIVTALGDMGVQDVYADVMKLYREGKINQRIVPPGTARQMLLSKRDTRLNCARHALWERYDQHGPFERENAA